MLFRPGIINISLLLVILFIPGFSSKSASAEIRSDDKRVLLATGSNDYPPFEYIDSNGNPAGFNIEVIKAVARVMNLNIKIELTPWTDVIQSFKHGKADIVTGFFRSREREEFADFTIPYFKASYSIFVREGSPITGPQDLAGRAVIVKEGAYGHDFIVRENIAGKIIAKSGWKDVFSSLSGGEGDCAVAPFLHGEILIRRMKIKNVKFLEHPLMHKNYCIAVRNGNQELLSKLNEGLSVLKSTGEFDSIYEKWFGGYEVRSIARRPFFRWLTALLVVVFLATSGIYFWNIFLQRKVREKTEALNNELARSNEIQRRLEEALDESSRAEEAARQSRTDAEKANEAKSVFLASISHELRTPLNGIIGMTQLIEATDLSQEQRALLDMLRLSADNLLRVLTDLLDYSRIGTGKFRLETAPLNLDEFVGNVAPVMELMAKEKNLDFRLRYNNTNLVVLTDKDRVGQIIFNLVNNAVKYTPAGTITLEVYYDAGINITVSDTGIGIPPDRIRDIFTPFGQIKREGDAKNSGLGLGLSIVRMLLKMMDGSIDVRSVPSCGSTFIVKIPSPVIENRVQDESIFEDDGKPEHVAPGVNVSVLIAEDEVINRIYLERILSKRGFTVDEAMNGLEAVEKYKSGDYDVILMDINMPGLDGHEAARCIREHEAGRGMARVPIIAVTAHAYPEDIKRCMDSGMDSYIPKPYEIGMLMKEIGRVCARTTLKMRSN